jgi:hypothetical protein
MDLVSLSIGVVSLASGAPMLLVPRRSREKTQAVWKSRVAELNAGADERYFEEGRTLDAYPPIATDTKKRAFGGLLVVIGLALIVMAVVR